MDLRHPLGKWPARRIALLALFSALAHVGRLIFAFIPNVQPMSALLLLISVYLGLTDGLIVTVLSLVLSNLFLGFGPWTVHQIVAYSGVLLILTPLLRWTPYRWLRSLEAGAMGMMYGWFISLLFVWSYQINHFWAYYLRGVPFDLNHALGNIVFYFLLEPIVLRILPRKVPHFNKRSSG